MDQQVISGWRYVQLRQRLCGYHDALQLQLVPISVQGSVPEGAQPAPQTPQESCLLPMNWTSIPQLDRELMGPTLGPAYPTFGARVEFLDHREH